MHITCGKGGGGGRVGPDERTRAAEPDDFPQERAQGFMVIGRDANLSHLATTLATKGLGSGGNARAGKVNIFAHPINEL